MQNSLGQVLVDGNQLDISNINCYLQLLAQTANKKEKLRRKKRRERREKKKGNSSNKEQRRKARKSERGEGKEKEIEPDLPADHQQHIKSEHLVTPSTDENGLTLAPTLPSQSGHPNGAMGRRAVSSPMAELAFDHHVTSSFAPPSRSSSWSQFIIDHTQQQQQQEAMSGYMNASPPHVVSNPNYPQQFLHRSSPAALYGNVVGHQPYMQLHPHQQPQHVFDPAAEFIQFMTEHQSCSNPSFTFSSSFSSDALSPITEENFMGFATSMPCGASSQSPFLGQHVASDPMRAQVQMHHHHPQQPPPPSNFYAADFGGLLASSTPTSSFGMEPIDDRDGTFASLEFLEAALAQDMRDA
jgi:hypothetical protein